ncbi:hypothetical protein SY88_21175 [Clostridiales bacterium PH28_bin88]|nr:hypothetical protein SY88_21175 [Clostridiales bacterium PH28_bin88]
MVCPACNGIIPLSHVCPRCGSLMEDTGPISLFYGPYSPYEDLETLVAGDGSGVHAWDRCIHLLACSNCGTDRRVMVDLVTQ